LDNAWINFDQCELPASALLGKHAEVTPEGEYRLKTAGVLPFEMIGQRLYTGRVAVAQAALAFRSELFRRTRAYSDAKPTYARGVDELPVLSDVPQLRALFEENAAAAAATEAFVGQCEARLSECLVGGTTPPPDLVDAIATAKVVAVEQSIDACHRLKQEVGSFALMADAGFLHLDMLQCCKFAEVRREKPFPWPPLLPVARSMTLHGFCLACAVPRQGDSRILMQKLARDRLKRFAKEPAAAQGADTPEAAMCRELASKMAAHPGSQADAWTASWREVYALAEAVMTRVQNDFQVAK